MPASTIESTIAGPACCAAASPVSTKMPVPMMAPMPSVTRLRGPSTRLSECSPVAAASAFSCSIDFVAKMDIILRIGDRSPQKHADSCPRLGVAPELYLVSRGKPLQVSTHATFGVAAAQQIADDSNRRGAGGEDL